jgi:hypothetical protein
MQNEILKNTETKESILIQKMVEANKLMPLPVKITPGFVDRFYNQFNIIVSSLSSTTL